MIGAIMCVQLTCPMGSPVCWTMSSLRAISFPLSSAMRQAEGEDWGDDWEDDSIRELKQIFQVRMTLFTTFYDCVQGQSAMNDVLRELHRKMDEIIGRQERSLSVLTAIQVNCFYLL